MSESTIDRRSAPVKSGRRSGYPRECKLIARGGGLWLIALNVPWDVWIQRSTEARRMTVEILHSDIRDPFEASCVFAAHRGLQTLK